VFVKKTLPPIELRDQHKDFHVSFVTSVKPFTWLAYEHEVLWYCVKSLSLEHHEVTFVYDEAHTDIWRIGRNSILRRAKKVFFSISTVKASYSLRLLSFLQHEFRKQCESNTSVDHVSSEQVEELDLVHKICRENISAFYEVAIIRNFFKNHAFVRTQHYGSWLCLHH
jgi:hypothetical protein